MSSINPLYTFHYSQPSEYRFSHDSIFLAHQVWLKVRENWGPDIRVLDLCAGCGVVGLDFLFHALREGPPPRKIDFLEIQEVYRPYFEENLSRIAGAAAYAEFLLKNYSCLAEGWRENEYDLILCNPPYFFPGQGALSPSEFKNRCRFFIDSDHLTLIRGIERALAPGGTAYILMRDLAAHGMDVFAEARRGLKPGTELEIAGEIRGTPLVRLRKGVL